MNTKKSLNRIVAVVFVMTLLVGNGAQAAGLFTLDGGGAVERASLFDQATTWILGTWTGLTSIFASDSTTPNPGTQSCTNPAGCGGDTDHGPGIDPEG